MNFSASTFEAYQFNCTPLPCFLLWFIFIFHDVVPQVRGFAPIGMIASGPQGLRLGENAGIAV